MVLPGGQLISTGRLPGIRLTERRHVRPGSATKVAGKLSRKLGNRLERGDNKRKAIYRSSSLVFLATSAAIPEFRLPAAAANALIRC